MLMCMESVYVVGRCKLLTKGCSCLAVVHGYEVSFIPTAILPDGIEDEEIHCLKESGVAAGGRESI